MPGARNVGSAAEQLVAFIKNRLSPSDFARFCALLSPQGRDQGPLLIPEIGALLGGAGEAAGGALAGGAEAAGGALAGGAEAAGGEAANAALGGAALGAALGGSSRKDDDDSNDAQAHDSAGSGYFDMFPGNARVGVSDYGVR